jgi:glycosyltransferase involved in cell wall biosynthesis
MGDSRRRWGSADRPVISFAMPTYNNALELVTALDSIIAQIVTSTVPVEIAISDNASTDETEAVGAMYVSRFPFITYVRSVSNVGFDLNILKAIEISSGEYCWLFGDDLLMPQALATAVEAIEKHRPRLVSFNYEYHQDGEPLLRPAHQRAMASLDSPIMVDGADAFIEQRTLWFTFISSNVVARDETAIARARLENTRGFAHAYYLLDVCGQGSAVLLPDVGAITQWSAHRPALPPSVPTFTIYLPAIFQEWADRGQISKTVAAKAIAEIDFFIFPRFSTMLIAANTALKRGTDEERECYEAVARRQSRTKRFIIEKTPWFMVETLRMTLAVTRMKRALTQGPPSARRRYAEFYAGFALWQRLIVVALPVRAIDSVLSRIRRMRGRLRRGAGTGPGLQSTGQGTT